MRSAIVAIGILLFIPARRQLKPMEFIPVAPGEFLMGCSSGDDKCRDNEKPAHRIRITRAFQIQKYEVTQDQWRDVMGGNPSEYEGDHLPVQNVSWNNVQEFIEKLNAQGDGFRYRLPTEAEWEYAARAGSAASYPAALDAIAWYVGNSGSTPHPVGMKEPNAWGIYDMNGNVWEWVSDWFDPNYYRGSPATDPRGPESGLQNTVRGGSFSDNAAFARVSNRFGVTTAFGNYDLGFRLVRQPTEQGKQFP